MASNESSNTTTLTTPREVRGQVLRTQRFLQNKGRKISRHLEVDFVAVNTRLGMLARLLLDLLSFLRLTLVDSINASLCIEWLSSL